MPLVKSQDAYIGRKLLVLPYYGYGWLRADLNSPPAGVPGAFGPELFHVRVEGAIHCAGEAVGAWGTIDEAGHDLDKQWCCFYLRSADTFDFTAHPGHYMIWVSPVRQVVCPDTEKAFQEWVLFDKSLPTLRGYGMVAETAYCMEETYKKTLFIRKLRLADTRREESNDRTIPATNPRESFNHLFDRFNADLTSIADSEGFAFERRAGPNVGRTLRLKNDLLKRSVFLELKYNWTKSDFVDPIVTIAYGAWYRPNQTTFPLYVLTKVFYEGKLSELQEEAVVNIVKSACAEVKTVSQDKVTREGKVFSDWPKDASEGGSYYE